MFSARLNLPPADCKDSIEREFNGEPVERRTTVRGERRAPLVAEREA